MDPISLIVAALVAGITGAFQHAGELAARDAYDALKWAILGRYRQVRIGLLEEDPQSPERQAAVAQDLRRTGAAGDDEIVHLAGALLALIERRPPRGGAPGHRPLLAPDELIERAERGAGQRALGQLVERHVATVLDVRARSAVSDQDLLSGSVRSRGGMQGLSASDQDDIARLHERVHQLIQHVATRIETRKYRPAEEAIGTMHLSYADRQRAWALIEADKRVHISYQSLKTTVEFFSDFNELLIAKIEQAASPQVETNLILGNAILIYELTDYVIRYIEGFRVDGVQDVVRMHEEAKGKIADLRQQQARLEAMLNMGAVDEAVRNQTLEDIRNRAASIDLLEREWAGYADSVRSLSTDLGVIRAKIPTLEVIRENARVQINLIQAVAMLQILRNSVGTLQATILTLENMRLAALTPTRVRRLLGIT